MYIDTKDNDSSGRIVLNAEKADKLTVSAGSTSQPVYFKDGVPTKINYTIKKSVPSDAVFTDTHNISSNVVNKTASSTADTTSALTNGNVYLNHIDGGAVTSSHKISGSGATSVTADADGNIIISSTNSTYSAATSSKAGLMSAADKAKLDGIATGANNYTLPTASSTVLGGVKIGSNVNISNGVISVPAASSTVAGVTVVYPAAKCTTFTSDSGTVTPAAVKKAVDTFAITKAAGGTFSNDATTQGGQPSLTWKTWGENTPYIGYATDQSDGTFILASLKGTDYATGLAIGGASGDLLWKGNKVAVVGDIPAVGNGTITIKQAGVSKGTFTTNQNGNTTIELTDSNTTYSNASTTAAGVRSAADKTKLDGIAAGANKYSLPLASSSTRGGVKIGYTQSGKNYPVQLSNEKMYVNVPWTDTNTHYSAYLYATGSSGTAHAATTNGNTYLRLIENSTARSSIKVAGAGLTTVKSDGSGNITISTLNGTNAGDANTPIYLNGGTFTACTSLDLNTTGSAAKLAGGTTLTSSTVDGFLERNMVKWAPTNATAVGNNDGIIMSFGWSDVFGAQLWLDDGSSEGGMKLRNRTSNSWNPWRQIISELGGTLTGALHFANTTWNKIGDDCALGDCDQAGVIGIKGLNGATGIYFVPYSGSTAQKITIDGAGTMSITGKVSTETLQTVSNGVISTIGSQNNGWLHYSTNSPSGHWFNKNVSVQGNIYAGTNYSDLVLTSANYTSYAPTKTGSGASGTWRINITGNAATSNTATTSRNSNWLNTNSTLQYGASGLNYFNISGTAGSAANANQTPTADWYHIIRMNHANSNGYYTDIASCFHNNNMYMKRVAAGSSSGWLHIWVEGNSVTSAVWNDYAECRESDCEEFGYVLMEVGDDSLTKTTERLSHFAGVSSDTWGFSQGETDKAKTPIAVAGRVLVYTYQDRNNYKPGDCVCAAPGGTVDIMTREEIKEYPDRIVGTVSCIPDYEEWGGGEIADRKPVKVNNRIWIKVV